MQLLCIGDIAIADHHFKGAWSLPSGKTQDTDTRILFNWELPIGDAVNPTPRISGPRIVGDRAGARAIKCWAPGFAALANNHILDAGEQGLLETQTVLREWGFTTFGAGFSQAEIQAPIIWAGPEGQLGILNWVFPETHPDWGAIPGPNCWPGLEASQEAIRALKKQVDWVLIMPHWSDEDFPHPRPEDREIARALIAAGADMIIAHHPHVVRGLEMIDGRPVYYSLGNFYFSEVRNQQGSFVVGLTPRNREALVVRVTLQHGKRPNTEALSYWQGSDQTRPDPLNRAVTRMRKVSSPLTGIPEHEYPAWYQARRGRFNRWEYRLHFSLWQKGWKGVLRYPLDWLERLRSHAQDSN